jgi:hypothetical protein
VCPEAERVAAVPAWAAPLDRAPVMAALAMAALAMAVTPEMRETGWAALRWPE